MASEEFKRLLSTLFKSHPWHGVPPASPAPNVVRAYVENVPTDTVKKELDKPTGHLCVDRPHRFSSLCPTLYGYIPQTYCAEEVAIRCMKATRLRNVEGDGDPLDINILTEKDLPHGDLLLWVKVIGGLRMVDKAGSKKSRKGKSPYQADDKIFGVLVDDPTYGDIDDISQCPPKVVERIKHYYLSYKRAPGDNSRNPTVRIMEAYGRDEAMEVYRASVRDYEQSFGTQEQRLDRLYELLCAGLVEKFLCGNADEKLLIKVLQTAAKSGALARVLAGDTNGRKPRPATSAKKKASTRKR